MDSCLRPWHLGTRLEKFVYSTAGYWVQLKPAAVPGMMTGPAWEGGGRLGAAEQRTSNICSISNQSVFFGENHGNGTKSVVSVVVVVAAAVVVVATAVAEVLVIMVTCASHWLFH